MNRFAVWIVVVGSGWFLGVSQVAEAQSSGEKRFLQKTSIQVEAKPVEEVLRELCEKHKIEVIFDPSVEANAAGESPFTLTADGLTLGSVIDLACRSSHMTYSLEKGKLLISTQDADDVNPIVLQYPMAALGPIPDLDLFMDDLQLMTSGVWEAGDMVATNPQTLSVKQTRTVHAELQSLFGSLTAASTGRARPLTFQERANEVIVRKLQSPKPFSEGTMPASEVLDQLLVKNGIPYWVDLQALQDAGIDWTQATAMTNAQKMPTAARLDSLLDEHKLAWRVDNELVQITTRENANERMFTRVYDIRRAVTPDRPPETLAAELTSNKEFGPWEVTDGDGGNVMVLNTLLIVRHNEAIHAKLAALLK